MNEALTSHVTDNIFHAIWFYNLALEPKCGRRKRLLVLAAAAVCCQALFYAAAVWTPEKGRCLCPAVNLSAAAVYAGVFLCVLSASSPAKSVFLVFTYYSLCVLRWGFSSLAAKCLEDWLMRVFQIGFNLLFLALYAGGLRGRLGQIYRRMHGGASRIAAVSGLTFAVTAAAVGGGAGQSGVGGVKGQAAVMAAACLSVFLLLFYVLSGPAEEYRFAQLQLYERILAQRKESCDRLDQRARQMRHDIRHHNVVVAELAKKGDCAGILSYLREYDVVEWKQQQTRHCSNSAVNSLVTGYVKRAEREGIVFRTLLRLGENTPVLDVDLITVLGNITENAFRGCRDARERRVEIVVRHQGGGILIMCQNTCLDELFFGGTEGQEGTGIWSIRRIAAKYGGSADFYAEDGLFTCRVLLNRRTEG